MTPDGAEVREGLDILVVDDNQDSADTLAVLLELWGHSARVVYDGECALEVAREKRPQVILLDIDLPGRNGYDVARQLVRDGLAGGPVGGSRLIAMTGFGRRRDLEASRAAGFDEHLVKPVDPSRLRQLLSELAQRIQRC